MKINIEARPQEIAELLQAITSSKEQNIKFVTTEVTENMMRGIQRRNGTALGRGEKGL